MYKSVDKRIGFTPRFIALLVDLAIIVMIGGGAGVILGGVIGGVMGLAASSSAASENVILRTGFGGLAGAFDGLLQGISFFGSFYGLIEACTGASPGKMLVRIRIGTDDGFRAPIATLFLRYCLKNIGLVFSVFATVTTLRIFAGTGRLLGMIVFVGFFMIFFTAKQTLHDKIAQTAVFPKDYVI